MWIKRTAGDRHDTVSYAGVFAHRNSDHAKPQVRPRHGGGIGESFRGRGIFQGDMKMSSLERDQALLAALPNQYAKKIWGLLSNGATDAETPAELRAALAAARRCPDTFRSVVEKIRPGAGVSA